MGESASETGGGPAGGPSSTARGGDRRGGRARKSPRSSNTSPRLNYEWDGPKLSWETGAGATAVLALLQLCSKWALHMHCCCARSRCTLPPSALPTTS